MSSLADLFSPTFLVFLGILLLVVALLVVYFENKMRDQNHKIASMLSLVSTLAEDMNGVKFGLNHLARNTFQEPLDPLNTAFISSDENKLITVSDDENDSDEESDAGSDAGSVSTFEINDESEGEDEEDNEDEESSDRDDLSSHNDVKVLKLNISKEADEDNDYEENENLDDLEELDDQEDLDDNLSERSNLETSELVDDRSELLENLEDLNEGPISASDLKTININLEESHLDYKKLPLPKLRSIVAEKGLSADASKLKKNELLKLLGSE
jgi:hypothetical protein